MSSQDTARATLCNLNADSRLLALPPELRNKIYRLVITSVTTCYISKRTRPHKPGPLQVNRQIREEAGLMYYHFSNFRVIVNEQDLPVIENWIKTVTTSERRSISNLNFEFQLRMYHHAFCPNSWLADAIYDFVDILWRLYDVGVPRSAVRVFYVLHLLRHMRCARRQKHREDAVTFHKGLVKMKLKAAGELE